MDLVWNWGHCTDTAAYKGRRVVRTGSPGPNTGIVAMRHVALVFSVIKQGTICLLFPPQKGTVFHRSIVTCIQSWEQQGTRLCALHVLSKAVWESRLWISVPSRTSSHLFHPLQSNGQRASFSSVTVFLTLNKVWGEKRRKQGMSLPSLTVPN